MVNCIPYIREGNTYFVFVILQITILNTIEKCTCLCSTVRKCISFVLCMRAFMCVYSHVHTTYFTLVHFYLVRYVKDSPYPRKQNLITIYNVMKYYNKTIHNNTL